MTHQYKVGEWYKIRNGDDAQVLDVDYKSSAGDTIVGKVRFKNGKEMIHTWKSDGTFLDEFTSGRDLMPPVERTELWGNVYKESFGAWTSKELADNHTYGDRIGLVKITIQGDDFTIEKVTG